MCRERREERNGEGNSQAKRVSRRAAGGRRGGLRRGEKGTVLFQASRIDRDMKGSWAWGTSEE